MSYVVDTHALFWHLLKSRHLSGTARRILTDADSGLINVYIPIIVLGELQFILEKEPGLPTLAELLQVIDEAKGFVIVDITRAHVERLPELRKVPEMHDRLVVSVALEYEAKILTTDAEIESAGIVDVVW